MDNNKKLLYIINNEFYQLRDRLTRSGLDSALILMVIDGIRTKALEDVNTILLSDLADVELKREQEEKMGQEDTERGE